MTATEMIREAQKIDITSTVEEIRVATRNLNMLGDIATSPSMLASFREACETVEEVKAIRGLS